MELKVKINRFQIGDHRLALCLIVLTYTCSDTGGGSVQSRLVCDQGRLVSVLVSAHVVQLEAKQTGIWLLRGHRPIISNSPSLPQF